MKPDGRIKVFLAHGFDKERRGFPYSEMELAQYFQQALKKSGFHVLTGDPPEAEDIDHKIKKRIDEADVVLGLFSRRWEVQSQSKPGVRRGGSHYICPPFVLSECSYALGAHQTLDAPKLVGGFAEEGIDIKDLALVTAGGREILWFNQEGLENRESQSRISEYIDSIPQKLGRFRRGENLFEPAPYRQNTVRKVASVYRNGLGIFKNRYKVYVPDADSFAATQRRIPHFLHTDRAIKLPDFASMIKTPIGERFKSPFFALAVFLVNNKPLNPAFVKVCLSRQDDQEVAFHLEIDQPIRSSSVIEYEYAWGLPNLFLSHSCDMQPGEYNEVSLRAFHGRINNAELQINFEREIAGTQRIELFQESPFYQLSPQTSLRRSMFGKHTPLPRLEESIWDETYGWRHTDFYGTIKVSWRPS